MPAVLFLLAFLPAAVASPSGAQRATIIVGGDRDYPPYEFLDKEGRPAGYNVELTRAIAEVMGMNVEIRLGPWGQMRRALAEGKVDILQGVAFLQDRSKELDFSPPMPSSTSRSGPAGTRCPSARWRTCGERKSS